MCEMDELTPDIILRKENPFMLSYQRKDSGSEDERDDRIPDLEKDDFAIRRARLNQPKLTLPFNQYLLGSYANKDRGKVEEGKKQKKKQECSRCAILLVSVLFNLGFIYFYQAMMLALQRELPIFQWVHRGGGGIQSSLQSFSGCSLKSCRKGEECLGWLNLDWEQKV